MVALGIRTHVGSRDTQDPGTFGRTLHCFTDWARVPRHLQRNLQQIFFSLIIWYLLNLNKNILFFNSENDNALHVPLSLSLSFTHTHTHSLSNALVQVHTLEQNSSLGEQQRQQQTPFLFKLFMWIKQTKKRFFLKKMVPWLEKNHNRFPE